MNVGVVRRFLSATVGGIWRLTPFAELQESVKDLKISVDKLTDQQMRAYEEQRTANEEQRTAYQEQRMAYQAQRTANEEQRMAYQEQRTANAEMIRVLNQISQRLARGPLVSTPAGSVFGGDLMHAEGAYEPEAGAGGDLVQEQGAHEAAADGVDNVAQAEGADHPVAGGGEAEGEAEGDEEAQVEEVAEVALNDAVADADQIDVEMAGMSSDSGMLTLGWN